MTTIKACDRLQRIWGSLPLALISLVISPPLAADCWVSVHKGAISPVADSPFQPRNIYRAWRICLAILVTALLCYPQPSTADCWGTYSAVTGEYSPPMPTAQAALDWVTVRYESYYLGKLYCIYHPSPNEEVREPIVSFSYTDSVIHTSQPGVRWSSGFDQGVGIPVAYKRTIDSYSARGGLCSNWPYVGTNNYSYYYGGYLSGDPSCKPSSYVIKLTRDDGLSESGTVLTAIEPAKFSSLVARVYDQAGQPVSNVNVELTVDVVQDSGGHKHDHNRNTTQMGLLTSPQGTVSQNGKVLAGTTGADGLAFSFTAPAAAGDHTIKARCTDRTCTQQGPDRIWVGIQGLVAIPSSGFWNLYGDTGIHPAGHYLTGDALGKLMDLGRFYKQVYFPFAKPLQLNDASLERGGLFDIDWVKRDAQGNIIERRTEWWTPPHSEHRRGKVIDIQANGTDTAIPKEYFKEFEHLMKNRLGMTWHPEHLGQSGGHYHVRLLGVKQ